MKNVHLQNIDITFCLLDGYLLQTEPISPNPEQPAATRKLRQSLRITLEVARDTMISRRDPAMAAALYDILTDEMAGVVTNPAEVPPEYSIAAAARRLLLPFRTE
jgi:hypothetical protein